MLQRFIGKVVCFISRQHQWKGLAQDHWICKRCGKEGWYCWTN